MQTYYLEVGNRLKLSEFDIEYRLLDHLVAQMAITGFKLAFYGTSYTKLNLS